MGKQKTQLFIRVITEVCETKLCTVHSGLRIVYLASVILTMYNHASCIAFLARRAPFSTVAPPFSIMAGYCKTAFLLCSVTVAVVSVLLFSRKGVDLNGKLPHAHAVACMRCYHRY